MEEKTFVKISRMQGDNGDVKVTFLNATFREKGGSIKKYPDPTYGEWLLPEIFETNKIMATEIVHGFFKRTFTYFCPICEAELSANTKRIMQSEYQLKFKEFPPFTVQINMPSVVCPNCQKVCGIDLDGITSGQIAEAIIQAFNSQAILP